MIDSTSLSSLGEALTPLEEIKAFLRPLKVPQHAEVLFELGFDDVDDFKNFTASAVEGMRVALLGKAVPVGHVERILRAVQAAWPVQEGTVLAPIMPSVIDLDPSRVTAMQTPSQVLHLVALDVGAAASNLATTAHGAKVRALIDKQTKLCPEAPRLLFGREHDGTPVSEFNQLMNKVALKLLEKHPTLIDFIGSKLRPQRLIEAARVEANGLYDNWGKKGGSRAGGVAGDAGYRGGSPSSSDGKLKLATSSPTAVTPSSRITAVVRATELAALPQQIDDAHKRLQARALSLSPEPGLPPPP